MGKTGVTGVRRVWNAFFFSMQGLRAAWRYESAFRQEAVLAILLLPAAAWLGRSATERGMLMATVLIVLIVELLNSGLEAIVDRVGTDHHRLSGQAKDMGSAAVFVSLVLVCATWGMVVWERFFATV